MAKFPKMDKSEKEYERELRQFKWNDARAFVGVDFDSTGLARAKNLMGQAAGAALKKPYCKIGLVQKNLVFRIKHDKKRHFGEDDIILIRNYGDISGEESLSSKSKNQGVLGRATARDPLTVEWWQRTLGSTVQDPSDLNVMIPQFQSKLETLNGITTARAFDETIQVLDNIKGETRKVIAAFPAKNDRILLKKLVAGIAFHEKAVRAKQDQFQAKVGNVLRVIIDFLNKTSKERTAELTKSVQQGKKCLAAGDNRGALRCRSDAELNLNKLVEETSETFAKRMIALQAQKNGIHSDEFPLRLVASALSDASRRVTTATAEFKTLADEIDATTTEASPDKRSFKVVDKLEDALKKITRLAKDVETAAVNAKEMFLDCTTGSRLGRSADEWFETATTGLNDTLIPTVNKISAMITKSRSEAGQDDKELLSALKKLETVNSRLEANCKTGKLHQSVEAAQQAYDNAPRLVEEMLQSVVADTDNLQSMAEAAQAIVKDWEDNKAEAAETKKLVQKAVSRATTMSTSGQGGYSMSGYFPWGHLDKVVKHQHYSGSRNSYIRTKAKFEDVKQVLADLEQRVA